VDESIRPRGGPALQAAVRLVDAHADARCLVHGSPPDVARDLDLLVRPETEATLGSALARAGFARHRADWILIEADAAAAVSLTPTSEWALDPAVVDDLFATARPLPGTTHLVRASPSHDLLVLARRLAVHPGVLHVRHRARIDEAVLELPDAWSRAAADAPAWGCQRALAVLAHACAHDGLVRRRDAFTARLEARRRTGTSGPWAALVSAASLVPRPIARVRARRARGAVVALSGIDGAGKSTQAQLVADALWAAGYDPVVEWSRITFEASLDRIARPVKALLSLRSRGSRRNRLPSDDSLGAAPAPSADPVVDPAADPATGSARALRERSRLVGSLWAGIVAVVHAWSLRRAILRHLRAGRVVVRDRYLLDSVVQLEWVYADGRDLRWQTRLIRMLVPRPAAAFFLDIDPERAHGRKPEEFDVEQLRRHRETYARHTDALHVDVVDGSRPVPEVFQTLLRGTLARLAANTP